MEKSQIRNPINLLNKKILIILICINLIGCAIISDYYISQPTNAGINHKFWPNNGIVVCNLGDAVLYLQPQNSVNAADGGMLLLPIPIMEPRKEILNDYRKGSYLSTGDSYFEGNYFYIEILLRTKKDGFSFNPREVYLELDNSKHIQASKYLIPPGEFARPHNFWSSLITTNEYSTWKEEGNEQSMSKYFIIPPNRYAGFAIRFESPTPNPGTPFNIEIKGLKFFENIISIPKIKYKDKKRIRDWSTN